MWSATSRPARLIADLAAAAAEALVPLACAGCDRPLYQVCPECRAALAPTALHHDAPALEPGLAVWGCGYYEGPVRRLVLAWKVGGRRDIEPVLLAALSEAMAAMLRSGDALAVPDPGTPTPVLVTPVPSGLRRRLRGRPAVLRLTHPIAAALAGSGRPAVVIDALDRPWDARTTAGKGQRGRRAPTAAPGDMAPTAAPARAAIWARADLTGRTIVLVDDILTTGATLSHCAQAVRAAGGHVAGALVLAGARVRGRHAPSRSPVLPPLRPPALPPAEQSEP